VTGDDRRGQAVERPRAAFRPFTLALLVGVAALLPEAARVAAERPLVLLSWVAVLSASSLMYVVSVPKLEIESSLRMPLVVASIVVLPPPMALAANLVALASTRELRRGVDPWKILFNHAQLGLTAYLAAFLVQPLSPVIATLVAVPVFDLSNAAACALGTWLMGRGTIRQAVRGAAMPFPRFATSYVLIALMAVLIVVLHEMVDPWAVTLLVVPMWLGYNALRSAKTADERADELAVRVRELEVMHELGTALLAARSEDAVVALAETALGDVCQAEVAVAPEGDRPAQVEQHLLPGTDIAVWVPAGLDERRAAEVETICIAVGISMQRLRVEGELRESQRAQADLAEGILAEGTAARSRVALNVHDDVLPYLAAAQMQADNVLHAATLGRTEMVKDLAGRVLHGVSDGIAALRGVLDDLQRQTIVPGDLIPVVRRVSDEYRVVHGLDVELDAQRYEGRLSHAVEILLTETVMGLLANVVRHARASRVWVCLATEGSMVTAEVGDDGVGFDPVQVGAGHHGLALMRQRVAIVHGSFSIDSAPGRGTTVRVSVPSGAALLLRQPEQPQARQPDPPTVVRVPPVRR
jgi:signal transduction histidine kinase